MRADQQTVIHQLLNNRQERNLRIADVSATDDLDVVSLSFSSETPVLRAYGYEILDHSPGAADLTYLNDGAALLVNHNMDEQVGVVVPGSAVITQDRKARADVKFSRSLRAKEILQDVVDGIRGKVSFMYEPKEIKLEKQKEGEPDTYRITKWVPYEISIVSIPADHTVGIGRNKPINNAELSKGENSMENTNTAIDQTAMANSERRRVADIMATMRAYDLKVNNLGEMAQAAVNDGWPVERFKASILERLQTAPISAEPAKLNLTENEVKAYSLRKAILSQVPGSGVDASRELELSQEIQKRLGKGPQGIFIPDDVLIYSKKREMTVGTPSAGGYLKGTDLLAASFIELLRNKMLTAQLGVMFMPGLVGDVAIPKQIGGSTTYWLAESGTVTASDAAFSQVTLTPKTVGAKTEISRKLLLQGTPAVDTLVADSIAKDLALAIDHAVFHGAGTNEPTGIAITSGVGVVTGTTFDWEAAVEFETDVATANADINAMAYVTTPAIRGILKTRAKQDGYPQYLMEATQMNGYPVYATGQIEAGYMFFGDFSQVVIGEWGALDIMVNPYTNAASGGIIVHGFKSVDVGLRHAGAFAISNNVT